jgi:tetratricopeptide (TPR) repeat protein
MQVIGWTYHRECDFEAGKDYYERARAIHESNQERYGVMETTFELGQIAHSQGAAEVALARLGEALSLSQAMGLERWELIVQSRLGFVLIDAGRLPEAGDCLRRATRFFAESDDSDNLTACLIGLAALASALGDNTTAAMRLGMSRMFRTRWPEAIHPYDELVWERTAGPLKDALGEQAFAKAFERGHTASPTEAVAHAICATLNQGSGVC